jgi:hypothetical protein
MWINEQNQAEGKKRTKLIDETQKEKKKNIVLSAGISTREEKAEGIETHV